MRNELKVYNLGVQNEINKKEIEEIEVKRQLKSYLSDLKEKLSILQKEEKNLEEYNQGTLLSYSDSEFGGGSRFFEDDNIVLVEDIKKSIKEIHDYMNELDLRKISISDEINELERIEKMTTENFLKISTSQLN